MGLICCKCKKQVGPEPGSNLRNLSLNLASAESKKIEDKSHKEDAVDQNLENLSRNLVPGESKKFEDKKYEEDALQNDSVEEININDNIVNPNNNNQRDQMTRIDREIETKKEDKPNPKNDQIKRI